jgi:hypothetical protein
LWVFPVPTHDFITVASNEYITYKAQLTDATGRLLSTNIISNGSNEIDVRSLASGIYFLHLESSVAIRNFKIIKE